jgi:hypothetical protein
MRKSSYGSVSGSFTSGDILAVLFVGPIDPATKRGLSGFFGCKFIGYFAGNFSGLKSSRKQDPLMVIGHSDRGS